MTTALDALLSGEPQTEWPDIFPPRLSPSSLSKAVTCPEQWRRKYVLGEREPWGAPALIGMAVHHAAEQSYRHRLEHGEYLGLDDFRDMTGQAFEDKIVDVEKDGIDWGDTNKGDATGTSLGLASAYHPTTLTVEPVAVEEWVSCHIPGVEPEIIGRVDIREKGGILDIKTTGRKESKPKPDWHFRGMVYQLMSSESVPVGQPFSWHVLTKTKTPGVYTPETEPGLRLEASPMLARVAERRILAVTEQLTGMLERYGPEEPWPTSAPLHDWACSYCSWRDNGCAWWS